MTYVRKMPNFEVSKSSGMWMLGLGGVLLCKGLIPSSSNLIQNIQISCRLLEKIIIQNSCKFLLNRKRLCRSFFIFLEPRLSTHASAEKDCSPVYRSRMVWNCSACTNVLPAVRVANFLCISTKRASLLWFTLVGGRRRRHVAMHGCVAIRQPVPACGRPRTEFLRGSAANRPPTTCQLSRAIGMTEICWRTDESVNDSYSYAHNYINFLPWKILF
jgi:hypothetical protein